MHINEDKLLEYALKIVEDDEERIKIERHLKACQSCRSELKRALSDIDIISDIQLNHPVVATSTYQRKRSMLYPLVRAAALIIIGMAMGFGASSAWLADKPIRVVPQYITLSSPADSIGRYPVPDAIGTLPDYWDDTFGNYPVNPPISTLHSSVAEYDAMVLLNREPQEVHHHLSKNSQERTTNRYNAEQSFLCPGPEFP